uniref:Cystatin domain-containing protein n=1 Tax=Rhabditophanes sp. KR3021 TaxID=114890 RepID=A0AC35U9B6_9BILA
MVVLVSVMSKDEPPTGGWKQRDKNSEETLNYAKRALSQWNSQNSTSTHLFKLIKVTVAREKIVCGKSVNLSFIARETTCLKSSTSSEELEPTKCPSKAGGDIIEITTNIWIKMWENSEKYKITSVKKLN